MRTKKLFVILIAVAFAMSVLLCVFLMFSVKKIDVKFSVSENFETQQVYDKLEEFNGKNLLFLSLDKVEDSIDDFPYFEITSLKKSFPNVISIEVKERREVYDLVLEDKVATTSSDGFVLKVTDIASWQGETRERIILRTLGLNFEEVSVGSYLKCNDDKLVESVFEMAYSVQLTDCIKEISIEVEPYLRKDAVFSTYTGTKIVVFDADERGKDKAIKAFNTYYDKTNDYEKTYGRIEVFEAESGLITVLWSNR